jgi:hypothetical protein
MPRFAILEHTGAPDDPAGRHYDLLLEAGDACRTWRLAELPVTGGPPVPAVELPPHRLAWLDHVAGEVSGGRGFARRITAGEHDVTSSDAVDLMEARRFVILITRRVDQTMAPMQIVLTCRTGEWIVTWMRCSTAREKRD